MKSLWYQTAPEIGDQSGLWPICIFWSQSEPEWMEVELMLKQGIYDTLKYTPVPPPYERQLKIEKYYHVDATYYHYVTNALTYESLKIHSQTSVTKEFLINFDQLQKIWPRLFVQNKVMFLVGASQIESPVGCCIITEKNNMRFVSFYRNILIAGVRKNT